MTFLSPKGPITGGVYGLQRLVAESMAFQRRVGASGHIDAQNYVHRWMLMGGPAALKAKRPCAILWCIDPTWEKQAERNLFVRGTELALVLSDIDRAPTDRSKSGDDFCEWVDEVLQQIAERAGVDDRLVVRRLGTFDPRDESPIRHSRDWDNKVQDAYWDAWFRVETGV